VIDCPQALKPIFFLQSAGTSVNSNPLSAVEKAFFVKSVKPMPFKLLEKRVFQTPHQLSSDDDKAPASSNTTPHHQPQSNTRPDPKFAIQF
jgi:hypothetical protein